MGSEPMLTPKVKIPSTGGPEEGRTRDAASSRTANPTHYRLSYSGPYPRNSSDVCLVEHMSSTTSEGGPSASSFLRSSFLQAISAVVLWSLPVQKRPQAPVSAAPDKFAKIASRESVYLLEPSKLAKKSRPR